MIESDNEQLSMTIVLLYSAALFFLSSQLKDMFVLKASSKFFSLISCVSA